MLNRKTGALLMALAMILALLAGCAGSPGASDSQTTAPAKDLPLIKVGFGSPLSGASGQVGETCRFGAQMAFEDMKDQIEALGFRLEFVPNDDQADPKVGVAIANKLVSDSDVLIVIGHCNSGVTIAASAITDKAHLGMVTGMSTNVQVTERGLDSILRVCNRDDYQGAVGASFAKEDLECETAFVVHDKQSYGQGLADEFVKAAEEIGLEIVGYEGLTSGEVDFSAVLNQMINTKPDLVYYGGNYPEGSLLLKQMRAKDIDSIYLGGDGVDTAELVNIAGPACVGAYYTSMTPDLTLDEDALAWSKRFYEKYGKEAEAYSTYFYDAGLTAMTALEKAIKDNDNKKPTREQVVAAMQGLELTGITGQIKFDEKGDNMYAKGFAYQLTEEKYPGVCIKELTRN